MADPLRPRLSALTTLAGPTVLGCATAALASRPVRAWACSACYYGSDGAVLAYLGTTVLLSALPLLLIGGMAYWVVRRWRAHRAAPPEAGRPLGPAEASRRPG